MNSDNQTLLGKDINNTLNKHKVLGNYITEIFTIDSKICYLSGALIDGDKHYLYIPDDVTIINSDINYNFSDKLRNLKGTIKVIGGKNLENADYMFALAKASHIDFSKFEHNNLKSAERLFYKSSVEEIITDDNYIKEQLILCKLENSGISKITKINSTNNLDKIEYNKYTASISDEKLIIDIDKNINYVVFEKYKDVFIFALELNNHDVMTMKRAIKMMPIVADSRTVFVEPTRFMTYISTENLAGLIKKYELNLTEHDGKLRIMEIYNLYKADKLESEEMKNFKIVKG